MNPRKTFETLYNTFHGCQPKPYTSSTQKFQVSGICDGQDSRIIFEYYGPFTIYFKGRFFSELKITEEECILNEEKISSEKAIDICNQLCIWFKDASRSMDALFSIFGVNPISNYSAMINLTFLNKAN